MKANVCLLTCGIFLLHLIFPAHAQSPGGVSSGLRLWVKADGNITTSGSSVTSWYDNSTGARHLTSTGTYLPLLSAATASFNYHPFVSFSNDYVRFAGNILPANSAGSVFTIAAQTGGSGYSTLWDFYSNSPTINIQNGQWLFWDGGATYHTQPAVKGQPALSAGRWQHNQAASVFLDINGQSKAVNRAVATNGNNYLLGAGTTAAGEPWIGNIAENIVYSTALSGDDLIRVNSYLAIKYGITLDGDPGSTGSNYDYKSSAATIVWDGTVNALYHHRITGIGRDNNSALLQLKSQSIHDDSYIMLESAGIGSDNTFLLAGDNDGVAGFSTPYTPSTFTPTIPYMHWGRIWKVQETGSTGTVSVTVNAAGVTHLLVNTNADFSTGTPIEIALVNGRADVDLADGVYFTFAGPATGPGGVVSNLSVWLRADAGTSTTTHGAAVADWQDQSGQGRTHTQGTASSQPSYVGAGGSYLMNYNPAIRFTGVANSNVNNDYFTIPNFLSGTEGVHVFSVSRINGAGPTSWQTIYSFTADINHTDWYLQQASTRTGAVEKNNTSKSIKYALASSLMPKSGSQRVIWNGTSQIFTNTAYSITTGGSPNFTLGVDRNNTDPFTGDIQEVVVYAAPAGADMGSTELNRIQSYLAIKYGISLDPTGQADYLASDGTTPFWTGSSNTGYQQHIFGLGRDDHSSLYQRQAYSLGDSVISISLGSLKVLNTQNTTKIENDRSFLVMGDNDATGFTTAVTYTAGQTFLNGNLATQINAVSNRIWKAQATNQSSWMVNIYNNTLPHATYVLVGNDPAFPAGSTRIYPLQGGVAQEVVINDGDYLRMGALVTAPGAVLDDLVFWVKSDNAQAGAAWTDNSLQGNSIEVVGSPVLTAANAAHNYYPYYTGFSSANYFRDAAPSFTPSDNGYGTHTRTSYSVFSAARSTAAQGTGSGRIAGIDNDDFFAAEPGFSINNGNPYFYKFYETTGSNTYSADVVSGRSAVLAYVANQSANSGNGTMQIALDGRAESFNWSAGNYFHVLGQRLFLGYGTWDLSGAFPGDIMEVAWYKRALTADEQARVNSYLAIKNGVTLGTSGSPLDYLNTASETIWTGDASFQYNIAGIGRDDRQALQQKQSNSVNSLATGQIVIGLTSLEVSNAANTNSFAADNSYLIWGDNGITTAATTLLTTYGAGVSINHLQRVWKISNNGVTQAVRIRFPATLQPGALGGPCDAYRMITSNAGTITGSSITSIQVADVVGSDFEVVYTFPAGTSYFTLARVDPATAGMVFLPEETVSASNYGSCSDSEWRYFYQDGMQNRKLLAVAGFADDAQLAALNIVITPSGASFANAQREINLMPRIGTVTDVSAGTYAGVKVRVYYDPGELATTQLPNAVTNTWIKYEGDADAVKADILDNGQLIAGKALALTPNASGVEDGVAYVDFYGITSFSSFIYVSSTDPLSEVLPVMQSNLQAKLINNTVQLSWVTLSEERNNGFEVQRRTANGTWQPIGFVRSAWVDGTSSQIHNYKFTDTEPTTGVVQYRLRQLDADGHSSYSIIVAVRIESSAHLLLYPNPLVKGDVRISGLNAGDNVQLLAADGRLLQTRKATGTLLQLQLDGYSPGLYLLRITGREQSIVLRLMKTD